MRLIFILLALLASINCDSITVSGGTGNAGTINAGIITNVTVAAGSTLNNDIVAYWKMDEAGSINRADSVGSITLTNLPVGQGPHGTNAIIAFGADFEDADPDYLQSTNDPPAVDFNGDVSFTIALWFKQESETANQTLVAKYDSSGQAQWWTGRWNATDRYTFLTSTTGSDEVRIDADAYGAANTGVTNLLVAWRDAGANTINIQINNGTVDSAASTTIFNGNSPVTAGRSLGGLYWDGWIDEVGIWSRALTSGERTELYNSGIGKTYPF